jgi:hypothetical protein
MTAGEWRDLAACTNHPHLDWFDVECNLYECLRICVNCPVADECLAYAVRHECFEGVWGGEWGYRLGVLIRQGRGGR